MNDEAKKLHKAMCSCEACTCPITQMLEQNAAEFAFRASGVNAAAMEQFQLAVSAQNALLLQMQASNTQAKPTAG